MNIQLLCKQGQQGKLSQNFTTLLEYIQSADPNSPDFDEDNKGQGWGHNQFMAGGLNLSSLLTLWQDIGSIATAFKLVAAAIKTCQEAQLMCMNARKLMAGGFVSNACLQEWDKKCWIGAGEISAFFSDIFIHSLFLDYFLFQLFSSCSTPSYPTYILWCHKVTSTQAYAQSQAAIYLRSKP